MRIALRTNHAEQIIADRYAGASKPLTKTTSVRSPHDVQSWLANPKPERGDLARKFAAVPFYLELAGHCPDALPDDAFPAVFDLADGQQRYPDKGLVKTLLVQGLVVGRTVHDELIFELTERGRAQFLGQTA
ncbi:MAG: hypothetical protein IAE87_03600 [Rhodobacteraceae bacterium]|jgi:hypothetical protein|nr:hypothetical protein [Paracoccaceae bacterium]